MALQIGNNVAKSLFRDKKLLTAPINTPLDNPSNVSDGVQIQRSLGSHHNPVFLKCEFAQLLIRCSRNASQVVVLHEKEFSFECLLGLCPKISLQKFNRDRRSHFYTIVRIFNTDSRRKHNSNISNPNPNPNASREQAQIFLSWQNTSHQLSGPSITGEQHFLEIQHHVPFDRLKVVV